MRRARKTQLVITRIPINYYIAHLYVCPHCHTKITETNSMVMHSAYVIKCPHCGNQVDFRNKDGSLNFIKEERNREEIVAFILSAIKNDPTILEDINA